MLDKALQPFEKLFLRRGALQLAELKGRAKPEQIAALVTEIAKKTYAAREEDERRVAALRREEALEHFRALCRQAGELSSRVPDFDLMRELENDAFAEITRPGSSVTLEQAFYALHPELRAREAEEAARKAAEAVSAAVRSGAARPKENGAQSASLGAPSYRSMSKDQREALKRRIYAYGARGDHLPAGR